MPPILSLIGAIAVIGANSLALSPISAAVAASFVDVDAAGVMVAAAVYGLATAISALTLTAAIDRHGAAPVLRCALVVLAAGLTLSAAAPTLAALCLGQALAGLAAGVALPAIYARAAEVAPPGRESETLGATLTGWTVSMVFGVTVAALMADTAHWRLFHGLLAVTAAILALTSSARASMRPSASRATAASPLQSLAIPGAPALLLAAFGYMVAFYGLYSYLGAHLTTRLGVSQSGAGLAGLAYGVGFGVAALTDRALDRIGAERAAAPALVLLALVYTGLAALADAAFPLLAFCVVWGLVNHVGLTLLIGRLAALDPTRRGAVLGLNSAVTYVAVFAGALAFRPLYEAQGFAGAALAAAAAVLGAAALARAPAAQRRQPSS